MGHAWVKHNSLYTKKNNTSQVNLEPESLDDIKIPFI